MALNFGEICKKELFAFIANFGLLLLLLASLISPWYAMAATDLPFPLYASTSVFWWTGLETVYAPPLDGSMSINTGWNSFDSNMPRNVYFMSISLVIVAAGLSMIVNFCIILGLLVRPTARFINKAFCGYFKWPMVVLSFLVLLAVILSWSMFMMFNEALHHAHLCLGDMPHFPYINGTALTNSTNTNTTYHIIAPIQRDGMWCAGFQGDRKVAGGARWIYGPSLGWTFALCATVFAFWTFSMTLTIAHDRFDDIEPTFSSPKPKKKASVSNAKKKTPQPTKPRKKTAEEAMDEQEEQEEQEDDDNELPPYNRPTRRPKPTGPVRKPSMMRPPLTRGSSMASVEDQEDDEVGERQPLKANMHGKKVPPQRRRAPPVVEDEFEEDEESMEMVAPKRKLATKQPSRRLMLGRQRSEDVDIESRKPPKKGKGRLI